MTPTRGQLGTVVVRAWVDPGGTPNSVRARVLVIVGARAEMREVGVAAGLDEVLALIAEGLALVSQGVNR